MDYLKYWTPVAVLGIAFTGFFLGGDWVWLGIITFPALAVLDTLVGRDYRVRKMSNATLANIPIWLCCIGPVLLYFAFAWRLSVEELTGWQMLGGILSVGWMGVIPLVPAAHELYHMRNPIARTVGRYGHLCILDCTRDIGHVVGHHIDVATPDDGDTASRGTNLYMFTGNAVIESTLYALNMEANALKKKGLSPWHISHRVWRALLALVIFIAVYALATASTIPGPVFLTLLGGMMFGPLVGALAQATGATLGSIAIYMLYRSAIGTWLRAKFEADAGMMHKIATGIDRNAFVTLLTLRLIPSVPFVLINATAGMVAAPLRPYIAATFLGLLPSTYIYTWIGSGLGDLLQQGVQPDLNMLVSKFFWPLMGVAFLSILLPLMIKGGQAWYKRRQKRMA